MYRYHTQARRGKWKERKKKIDNTPHFPVILLEYSQLVSRREEWRCKQDEKRFGAECMGRTPSSSTGMSERWAG